MPIIRVEVKGRCDCGKPLLAEVGLLRGGQASVPCSCGFSLMVTAPKDRPTRIGINPAMNELKVVQVGDGDGDDADPDPDPEETKH